MSRSPNPFQSTGKEPDPAPARKRAAKASRPGKVILVGAGPGDPEFLTLRGYDRLQKADVVLHDALLTDALLEMIPAAAEKVYVGKRGGFKHASQDEINALLVEKAKGGKTVVRLKGGDPYIYGRGGEEAEYCLDHGLEVEVVPGLTSALAVPALAGIPVLHRELAGTVMILHGRLLPPQLTDEEIKAQQQAADGSEKQRAVIIKTHKTLAKEKCPDTRKAVNWKAICQASDTLVFLMFYDNRDAIQQGLLYGGRSPEEPVAGIRWGATAQQFTVISTVGAFAEDFEKAALGSPSVLVVGQVVKFAERLNFYEQRPLAGAKIILTYRPLEKAPHRKSIEELGAVFHMIPVLDVPKLAKTPDQINHLGKELKQVTHFLIMQPQLAEVFEASLERTGFDAEALLRDTPIICPTKAVEALVKECGLASITLPKTLTKETLEKSLGLKLSVARLIVLEEASEWNELTEELEALGVHQTSIPLTAYGVEAESLIQLETLLQNPEARPVLIWEKESAVRAVLTHFGSTAKLVLKNAIHLCLEPRCLETLQHREFLYVAELRSLEPESILQALQPFKPFDGLPTDATSYPG